MRRLTRVAVATTVLASAGGLLSAAGPAGAAGIAAHAARRSAAWRVEPTPAHDGTKLAAVACVGRAFCMAVGGQLGERWNGVSWRRTRALAGAAVLAGVACTSARRCVAVGGDVSGRAAAWSWNGRRWSGQAVPNPGSPDNAFAAITCVSATNCEAVGSHGSPRASFPLAERWNGTRWRRQSTSGAPAGTLAGVACQSRSRCEAVGAKVGKLTTTLAMGWNGSRWRAQRTPFIPAQFGSPPGEPYQFTGISCWSSGCTAVGVDYYCDCSPSASGYLLLAERWTGSAWQLQSRIGTGVSPSYTSAIWSAVRCRAASACTAVGTWTNDNKAQPPFTLISYWNGTRWRQAKSPSPNRTGNLLDAISCAVAACTAVGEQGALTGHSLAMRN